MCKTSPPMNDGVVPYSIDSVRCLLGDFSSAWDEFSDRNLYANGPSSAEQTNEYAPPEVLFQSSTWSPFYLTNPQSYDSWSIGVVVSFATAFLCYIFRFIFCQQVNLVVFKGP